MKITQLLEELAREQDFFRRWTLDLSAKRTNACINLLTHRINIAANCDWAKKFMDVDLKKYSQKKNVPEDELLDCLIRDIFLHEIGHRGTRNYAGCPETAKALSECFLEPMGEVLKENKQTVHYFANMLTDLIDNTALKRVEQEGVSPMTGLYLFFKEQGMLAVQKQAKFGITSVKFSKMYEAHVRLHIMCNGDKNDQRLLRKYFTYDPEINQAIQNFKKRTGLPRDQYEIRELLMDKDKWAEIATVYAEEFGKFMEHPPQESLFGAGGSLSDDEADDSHGEGLPDAQNEEGNDESGNSSGSKDTEDERSDELGNGAGKDEDEKNDELGDSGDCEDNTKKDEFSNQDGFGKELNQKETQKGLLKGRPTGEPPNWMNNYDYLVAYYELLASDKAFELEIPKFESKTYPLMDISERSFDLAEDSVRDIIGFAFNKYRKKIEMHVGKYKYNITARIKEQVTDLPDLILGMLDTSDSMFSEMPNGKGLGRIINPKGEVQWQENSRYHVSLITYFMIIQRFYELNMYESDAFFVNFSNATILSQGLKNSLHEALHPQCGGTGINLPKIEHILEKRNSIIFTISDGEIFGSDRIARRLIEVNEYSPVFHVQIGNHSQFSKKLQQGGVCVEAVQDEEQLYRFAIDLTDTVYGRRR